MTDSRPILDYSTFRSQSRFGLELQEDEGQVRVLFPATPRWVFLVPLAITAPIGLGCLFEAIRSLIDTWQIRGVGFRFFEWLGEERGDIFLAASYLIVAGLCYVAYLTWKRERSLLVATKDGLLWSRLTPFGRRTSWWPVHQIAAINLRRSWGNVAVVGSVGFLHIWLVDGRSPRFYLNSSSRRLPLAVAERLAGVLGCPVAGGDRAP